MLYIAKAFKDFNLIFPAFVGSAVYTAYHYPQFQLLTCMPLTLWKKEALGYFKINLLSL